MGHRHLYGAPPMFEGEPDQNWSHMHTDQHYVHLGNVKSICLTSTCILVHVLLFFGLNIFLVLINMDRFGFGSSKIFALVSVLLFSIVRFLVIVI